MICYKKSADKIEERKLKFMKKYTEMYYFSNFNPSFNYFFKANKVVCIGVMTIVIVIIFFLIFTFLFTVNKVDVVEIVSIVISFLFFLGSTMLSLGVFYSGWCDRATRVRNNTIVDVDLIFKNYNEKDVANYLSSNKEKGVITCQVGNEYNNISCFGFKITNISLKEITNIEIISAYVKNNDNSNLPEIITGLSFDNSNGIGSKESENYIFEINNSLLNQNNFQVIVILRYRDESGNIYVLALESHFDVANKFSFTFAIIDTIAYDYLYKKLSSSFVDTHLTCGNSYFGYRKENFL